MGALRFAHRLTLISILPRNSGQLEQSKLKLSPDTCRVGCVVQHVRPSRKHCRVEHLSGGRQAALSAGQQDPAGYMLFQHCAVLVCEVLLHHQEQEEGSEMGGIEWRGEGGLCEVSCCVSSHQMESY